MITRKLRMSVPDRVGYRPVTDVQTYSQREFELRGLNCPTLGALPYEALLKSALSPQDHDKRDY